MHARRHIFTLILWNYSVTICRHSTINITITRSIDIIYWNRDYSLCIKSKKNLISSRHISNQHHGGYLPLDTEWKFQFIHSKNEQGKQNNKNQYVYNTKDSGRPFSVPQSLTKYMIYTTFLGTKIHDLYNAIRFSVRQALKKQMSLLNEYWEMRRSYFQNKSTPSSINFTGVF